MRLFALSAGIEAPTKRFSGIVHSVFERACNIGLETGALLTLVSSEKPNLPNGLRIETPARFAFPDFVHVGEPAACREGTVRFTHSVLSIDLWTATCWHIDLSGLRIDLHRPDQTAAWKVAWHTLRHYQRGDTIAGIIAAMAQAEGAFGTIPALLEATKSLHAEKACAAIGPLIGLGPGLTPAGDDFLVGYLAGLWSTARLDTARQQFLTSVGMWLSEAASQTTVISQASIQSAVRGHASEPIARLAQLLDRADNIDEVRAETQAALQVGHSSGTDGVTGLLFGCAAWTRPSLPAFHCLGFPSA
ncbi:MAG: DUF2877 domain-containing protein [Nitrospira sp.]|nr:DUF2877 domain-containing protein [Nitrospira sp.]MBH0197205.1 DUF2877 domain-containing protein [Nitrospira sp.]